MYRVIFYTTVRGDSPVEEFIGGLEPRLSEKVTGFLRYLGEKGPMLHRPYADHVRGSLRELRVQFAHNSVRILYFFMVGQNIVLLHGFFKKDRALRELDIDLAENRMRDWLSRHGGQK